MTVLAAPELTLHQSVPYVAAAYIVFLSVLLVYVTIMAVRQRRTERNLEELRRDVQATVAERSQDEQANPRAEATARR